MFKIRVGHRKRKKFKCNPFICCGVINKNCYYEKILPLVFSLLIIVSAAGCKKDETKALENGEIELTLNNCGTPKNEGNNSLTNVTVCFTNLVIESRCPTGAECI